MQQPVAQTLLNGYFLGLGVSSRPAPFEILKLFDEICEQRDRWGVLKPTEKLRIVDRRPRRGPLILLESDDNAPMACTKDCIRTDYVAKKR